MLRQIAFQVRGEVQGVNFRSWTAQRAKELGVSGWVRNTDDGHVCGEALGEKAAVDKFVGMLNEGPRIAQVSAVELDKDVEVKDAQSAGWSLSGFEVRR